MENPHSSASGPSSTEATLRLAHFGPKVLPGVGVLHITREKCNAFVACNAFSSSPPPSGRLASSIGIQIDYLKAELDGSRSPGHRTCLKQQAGKLAISKSKAGSTGVPECLSGKIREGNGIKHEEADKQLKG